MVSISSLRSFGKTFLEALWFCFSQGIFGNSGFFLDQAVHLSEVPNCVPSFSYTRAWLVEQLSLGRVHFQKAIKFPSEYILNAPPLSVS